jgi:hypothetical protein
VQRDIKYISIAAQARTTFNELSNGFKHALLVDNILYSVYTALQDLTVSSDVTFLKG